MALDAGSARTGGVARRVQALRARRSDPGVPTIEHVSHHEGVVACGAPPAREVGVLVGLAQERTWDVCVLTTPQGRMFVDVATLDEQTGYPVRSEYKHPDQPDVLPAPDAVIVAPATTNTVNKWAAGISDTLPPRRPGRGRR